MTISKPATRFHVDARLLSTSDYFQAALKADWVEGQMHTVTINDIEPRIFNTYLNFQQNHHIFALQEPTETWFYLSDCYFLGDRLMDADSKDAILDACFEYSHEKSFRKVKKFIKLVYDRTPPGARLREFVV